MSRRSSKWEDMKADLTMAQAIEPLLPSLAVDTLTLALDDVLAPKARLEGPVERQPELATTGSTGKTINRAGSSTRRRPRGA